MIICMLFGNNDKKRDIKKAARFAKSSFLKIMVN